MKSKETDRSLLWRLLRESIPRQKVRYGIAIVAMAVSAGTAALAALAMGQIVDTMTEVDNRGQSFAVAGAVFGIFFARGIAEYVQAVFLARAGNDIIARKQNEVYRKILNQGVSFFDEFQSSQLLLRVTKSAQRARKVVDTIVTGYVRDALTLLGLLAIMIYQQPILSGVWLLCGPIAVYYIWKLMRKLDDILKQELGGMGEIIKVTQESAIGARVIKVFSLEDYMRGRMAVAVKTVRNKRNKIAALKAATQPLLNTLTGIAIASIVIVSTLTSLAGQTTSPGQLISFVTALLMAYEPAIRLSRMRLQLHHGMHGVRMLYGLIDHPSSLTEHPDATDLPDGPGHIRLENISFSYNEETFIHNLSLDFEARKTTALVGPSGSGKSTLFNLILRLYDPNEGRVTIDGHDIAEATFASLRQKISYVGQDTFLFDGTIEDNIRVGKPDATNEEVIDAARVANADEFISQFRLGYKTLVGENGTSLSGGQKQRIAIARAVLRRAEILLLDEVTSAQDSRSEALVRDALKRVMAGKTTILIAHRVSTILSAEHIVYLENGEVVETGLVDELLSLEDGKFRALIEGQRSDLDRIVTKPDGDAKEA